MSPIAALPHAEESKIVEAFVVDAWVSLLEPVREMDRRVWWDIDWLASR